MSDKKTEESTPLAFEWVHQNLERFVQGIPEATVGQVFAGARAPASRDDLERGAARQAPLALLRYSNEDH